jgi:hypothetical protein
MDIKVLNRLRDLQQREDKCTNHPFIHPEFPGVKTDKKYRFLKFDEATDDLTLREVWDNGPPEDITIKASTVTIVDRRSDYGINCVDWIEQKEDWKVSKLI